MVLGHDHKLPSLLEKTLGSLTYYFIVVHDQIQSWLVGPTD